MNYSHLQPLGNAIFAQIKNSHAKTMSRNISGAFKILRKLLFLESFLTLEFGSGLEKTFDNINRRLMQEKLNNYKICISCSTFAIFKNRKRIPDLENELFAAT
jgi:hypothetical protein